MTDQGMMTKGEREDLQRLVRQREKILKEAAKQRSAELLADFENQMGQEFSFDQDPVWALLAEDAKAFQKKADQMMAESCAKRGVPKRFAPSWSVHWNHRGYDNLLDKRKAELRRMARTQIAAIEQKAIVDIGMRSVEAQTALAMAGLTSEAAQNFLQALPSIEKLMPSLSFAEVAGEADPPVAEQLVSSNALRQRRFRERQAALQKGNAEGVTSALCNGSETPEGDDSPEAV